MSVVDNQHKPTVQLQVHVSWENGLSLCLHAAAGARHAKGKD